MSKGQARSSSSVYFVPELDQEIRVDYVNINFSVAHYPTGPERVGRHVLNRDWVYKGDWEKLRGEDSDRHK